MESRRTFLKKSSAISLGAILLTDPLLKGYATLLNLAVEEIIKQYQKHYDIIRPKDFLYLRYYFLNFKQKGNSMQRIDPGQDAFIIVRLPQQHIGEQVQKYPFIDNKDLINFPNNEKYFSKSFISGFSYLTFKVPRKITRINLKEDELLDWSRFELFTINDLNTYPDKIPVKFSSDIYPLNLDHVPTPLAVAQIGNLIIPVTLFEVPYKMFLSPVAPYLRPDDNTLYSYGFSKKNTLYEYLNKKNGTIRLNELWNNDLVYRGRSIENGITNIPPNFKVLAFSNEDSKDPGDNKINLLPTLKNRDELAQLTNIKGFQRDVESKYFNVSSFGATTYLQYDNLAKPEGIEIVGWKQDIVLGRDNYVEIIKLGIDTRSGLKVLLSDIAERRVEKGKSLLIERAYLKFLEKEKEYMHITSFPFVKIIALEDGSFYKKDDSDSFTPMKEDNNNIKLIMPFRGLDKQGKWHDVNWELNIIRESLFDKGKNKVVNALNNFNKGRGNDPIYVSKYNVAYYQLEQDESEITQNDNTNLITEEFQLFSYYNGEFKSKYPVIPQLKYAKVYIPQLEGLEPVPQLHYVGYSKTVIKSNFENIENNNKIFLQILNEDITIKDINLTDSVTDYQNELINVYNGKNGEIDHPFPV